MWPIFVVNGLDWQCCFAGSSRSIEHHLTHFYWKVEKNPFVGLRKSNLCLLYVGVVDCAFHLVASNGLEQTQFLAKSYGKAALHSIQLWKDSHAKDELIHFITTAIERTKWINILFTWSKNPFQTTNPNLFSAIKGMTAIERTKWISAAGSNNQFRNYESECFDL